LAGEVRNAVYLATLRQIFALAASPEASGAARGIALGRLNLWRAKLNALVPAEALALQQFTAFDRDPKDFRIAKPAEAPPGMPIGDLTLSCDWM